MARNKSERLTPTQVAMVATRDALRALVKACLKAGYPADFDSVFEWKYFEDNDANGFVERECANGFVERAFADYSKCVSEWHVWKNVPEADDQPSWAAVLEMVEAHVEKELGRGA